MCPVGQIGVGFEAHLSSLMTDGYIALRIINMTAKFDEEFTQKSSGGQAKSSLENLKKRAGVMEDFVLNAYPNIITISCMDQEEEWHMDGGRQGKATMYVLVNRKKVTPR